MFLLSITLMVSDNYGQYLAQVRSALLTTLTPIEQAANLPFQLYKWAKQDLTKIQELEKTNQELRTENLLLKTQQLKLTNLQQEVENLNKLLGSASKHSFDFSPTIASVIFYSSTPYSEFYKINKGMTDNLSPGQAVLDSNGIIGQVVSSTPSNSRVLLITDPESQVPVRIQRTGQRGILSGLGNTELQLNFIANSSSVEKGDVLETSGLGGIYPVGYPIATITEFTIRDDTPYFNIRAHPISQLKKTDKVLVLSKNTPPSFVSKGATNE